MDDAVITAALEAQMLMGHCVPSPHMAHDRRTIRTWSWDVDEVRQALHVPANAVWDERVLLLEAEGLASFSFYAAPSDDNTHWQDEPRDKWGSVGIHPYGVLKLAALYARPYVRYGESPAVLAHWTLVQGESEARLHRPYDQAQLEREWPERTRLWKAQLAEWEQEQGG